MTYSANSYFSNSVQGVPQVAGDVDIFANDASPKFVIGYKLEFADGRVFRYAQFGATVSHGGVVVATDESGSCTVENALVPVVPSSANTTSDGTVGSKYLQITEPSITTDQFAGGYLVVIAGTGRGYTYRIKGNSSCNLSDAPASGDIRMELYDKIQAELNAASDVNVIGCKYSDLKPALAGTDEIPCGVSTRAMTADYYGWVQTKGIGVCALNAATTCLVGDILVLAAIDNTAELGSVARIGQFSTSTELAQLATEPIIGICTSTVTSAAGVYQVYVGVDLMLE